MVDICLLPERSPLSCSTTIHLGGRSELWMSRQSRGSAGHLQDFENARRIAKALYFADAGDRGTSISLLQSLALKTECYFKEKGEALSTLTSEQATRSLTRRAYIDVSLPDHSNLARRPIIAYLMSHHA